MFMINDFFMLCIICIPCVILKIEDIQKILTWVVYMNIVYLVYIYYTDPLMTLIFNSIINNITGNTFNLTGI
jgi:hypothetical protein